MNRYQFIIIVAFTLSFIKSYGQAANWNWASQVIGNDWSIGEDIASDDANNVYSCGFFMDSASFGDHHLYNESQTAFVVKYDTHGEVCWVNAFPSNHSSFAERISVDHNQNVLVLGYFSGILQVGNDTLSVNSAENFFLIKMDSSGTILWARQSNSEYVNQAVDITIDNDNNIYIAGDNYGLSSYGNLTTTKIGMFILKYTPDGEPVMLINESGCNSHSINVDCNHQIYYSGLIVDTTTIGDEPLYPTGSYLLAPTSSEFETVLYNSRDPVFISYTLSGELSWIRQAKSNGYDNWTYSTMDESSNWYIIGNIIETTDFWGTIINPGHSTVPYLLKLNSLGNIEWIRSGEPVSDNGWLLLRNLDYRDEKIYMVGQSREKSLFAGLDVSEACMVILKVDTTGDGIWALIDSTNQAIYRAHSVSTGTDYSIAISGYFEDSVHFGPYYLRSYGNGSPIFYAARMASSLVNIQEPDKIISEDGMKIYPNPSSGSFKVEADEQISRIRIMNQAGMIVQELQPVPSLKHQISIDHPGLFLIRVCTANRTYTGKVIIAPGAGK